MEKYEFPYSRLRHSRGLIIFDFLKIGPDLDLRPCLTVIRSLLLVKHIVTTFKLIKSLSITYIYHCASIYCSVPAVRDYETYVLFLLFGEEKS